MPGPEAEEAWNKYLRQETADYRSGRNTHSSVPRLDTFMAGWNAAHELQEEK